MTNIKWEEAATAIFEVLDKRNLDSRLLPQTALIIYRQLMNEFHKHGKRNWKKLINEFIDRELAKGAEMDRLHNG